MRTVSRSVLAVALVVVTIMVGAQRASAHVTIPDPGEKGGFSIVTFSVPNERPDAGTTKVEVKLPEDRVLPFVSVQPKTGWTVETTMRTLDEPVEAFGEEVTEVVDLVTWSGGTIGPDQFDTFALSVGPLPDDVDELAFPTIQTYSSGEEVAWIEETPEGGEEPENPAPLLRLVDPPEGGPSDETTTTTAATTTTVGADNTEQAAVHHNDDGTDAVAVAALLVGIVAVVLAGGAFVTARRSTQLPTRPGSEPPTSP